MPTHPCRTVAAALTLCSLAHAGGLQNGWKAFRDPTIQDHGYEWSNIGHARNADWVGPNPTLPIQTVRVGGVNHRYRIAKTEVTNRQWYEFVLAYAPFVSPQAAHSNVFTGVGIITSSGGGYVLGEESAEFGATVGMRYATRYVNWLHNNKVNEAWAFESGVYDTSTFGSVSGSSSQITDQRERSEGARYFLPTWDEWTKASHFDPNRYGEGQEGYWLYPYSSDAALVAGVPGTPGAQTNGGTFVSYPILSYSEFVTPWGLFDASGSVTEWMETFVSSTGRAADSSGPLTSVNTLSDRISNRLGGTASTLHGVRIASIIPGPGAPMLALTALLAARTRRR